MSSIGSKPGQTQSYLTAVDMVLGQAVVQDTTGEGKAKLPTAINEECLGIVSAKALANTLVTLVQGGFYWAIAKAPILVGSKVIIAEAATGKLITDPATAGTVSKIVGIAETAAGADGDQFIVRIQHDTIYYHA